MSSLSDKAEEYFSAMNSMARRMCVDMQETKTSYENLWETLSHEEQQQILTQSIIKPEVSLKYPMQEETGRRKSEYAVKMIVDDNYAYRDEHSGPFTFRSCSQRDLSAAGRAAVERRSGAPPPKAKVLPARAVVQVRKVEEVAEVYNDDDDEGDANSLTHILPKTGLDLLDNW